MQFGDGSNQIKKEDRPHLLKTFRALLYADTECEYMMRQNELLSDNICKKYPHYINVCKKLTLTEKKRGQYQLGVIKNFPHIPQTHQTMLRLPSESQKMDNSTEQRHLI